MRAYNRKRGYFLGIILSTIAAALTIGLISAFLQMQLMRCFMSQSCREDASLTTPLVLLGGFLLIAVVLAVSARLIFNSSLVVALLLNVAPFIIMIALIFLLAQYNSYANRRDDIRAFQHAIDEAPAIHLGAPYVKKVDRPNGGVTLFLHVPFTVTRTVQARSMNILATLETSERNIRYSSDPNCNGKYHVPPYGFHIVDREYVEPPLPIYVTGMKVASEQLQPDRQYYLLREMHFGYSLCRVSNYQDFDPKQLNVTLNTSLARQKLIEMAEQ
jgi:hypothetical protein